MAAAETSSNQRRTPPGPSCPADARDRPVISSPPRERFSKWTHAGRHGRRRCRSDTPTEIWPPFPKPHARHAPPCLLGREYMHMRSVVHSNWSHAVCLDAPPHRGRPEPERSYAPILAGPVDIVFRPMPFDHPNTGWYRRGTMFEAGRGVLPIGDRRYFSARVGTIPLTCFSWLGNLVSWVIGGGPGEKCRELFEPVICQNPGTVRVETTVGDTPAAGSRGPKRLNR
jgi:hypothetical protein